MHPFFSIHEQGFVRVAAGVPLLRVADPEANAAETLELMRGAAAQQVDLMVFPELGLSAYAIDDLLLQDALLDRAEAALAHLLAESAGWTSVFVLGMPVRRNHRIYNCGVAICAGRVLGVVPKTYLPNYREYYEARWFASGADMRGTSLHIAGQDAPFGIDLIFASTRLPDFSFHLEICEDFWGAIPPSSIGALAGAAILCNLSASNAVVGKAEDRAMLCASQSIRCHAAYVYSAAGMGESTTDLAWDGQATIHELGACLGRTERFAQQSQMIVADVDVQRIRLERARTATFNNVAANHGHPELQMRRIAFGYADTSIPAASDLRRAIDRFPYVPDEPRRLDNECYEAFNIQVQGLMQRMRATGSKRAIIGVSGGLDSTHALIVAAKAFDKLGFPRSDILGFTMPGFATSDKTKSHAWQLMNALQITGREIDIKPSAQLMLKELGHPAAEGQPVYDITFENVQAGLRTDFLFRLANRHKGFVLGTGDLSELALGWCTYGVGDHMSHYNVNGSAPKTLIQSLIRWVAQTNQLGDDASRMLLSVLHTEISPELVPAGATGAIQSTEATVGPYELQDFNLYYITRFGLPPSKVAFLAWHAWRDAGAGQWPPGFPEGARHAYALKDIKHWLGVFVHRFFQVSQFKRSALPNGPKIVAGGSLSPRGDWRAPSDASARAWLDELASVPDE